MSKKTAILKQIQENLTNKKHVLKQEIEAIQASANNETKSSAGDKYETSRAMAQIEIDRLKANVYVVEVQIADLEKIKRQKPIQKATSGALVTTNQGLFLLGLGLGKVETPIGIVFALSMDSPLGQKIKGKQITEVFSFGTNDSCVIIEVE